MTRFLRHHLHCSLAALASAALACASELPDRYFQLLEAGAQQVQARLAAEPAANLETLEKTPGWKHFGYSILAPAVLYAKKDAANARYHDPAMLALAERIGDLLASEDEKGAFAPRLDADWDTYTWLEAYRLLEPELGPERRERWKRAILRNTEPFYADAAERIDFPWYQSPYIGTSPNHYSQWAELLFLAGRVFAKPDWVELGTKILHRFAVEQAPDGYWGEHSSAGPTIGYDHLTLSAVALFAEYVNDPAVMQALRRSTDFHMHFTYPDGSPVETVNNRNRYWGSRAWSHFAFTHSPDGRRYAEFLAAFFDPAKLAMDDLGRLAQNALYYHAGDDAPIPQDQDRYVYRLQIPAGIRKTGPWVVSLSGIVETQAVNNQFYLDRQANLSVFHSKLGLIVSGANSKRQPELATFREKLGDTVYTMPLSSRLDMGEDMSDAGDRLSLAFNTFFSTLHLQPAAPDELKFRFVISGKGTPPAEAFVTLQLVLRPGEVLETGAGKKITLGEQRVELTSKDIGGSISHHGWTLAVDPNARLVWPVYPYNPYADAPEKTLDHAVGALSVPLALKSVSGKYVRPNEQQIGFTLTVQ